MKSTQSYLLLLLSTFFLLLSSCKKDDFVPVPPEDPVIANNRYVNSWIDDNMRAYYLWSSKIPAASALDYTKKPDAFFNSMLYKFHETTAPDGDRFSWIQESYVDLLESLRGVVRNELGFEYDWYGYNANDVFGEFCYIKKGTDAAAKGLKRGQVFTHINGTKITTNNYRNLLSEATAKTSVDLKVYDAALDMAAGRIDFKNERNITVNLLSKYAENPVYLDTVYTINGKKIAYLVYHFFAVDAGDGTGSYDIALNTIFGKFKSRGVDELILDLRYNNGGAVSSVIHLSSMIVKNLNVNNVFSRVEYNPYQSGRYRSEELIDKFVDKVVVYGTDGKAKSSYPLNNLGNLQTLYVLTGQSTASASELVINGLKPYMPVFLVGDVTVGKNVGSISVYKTNDSRNKWGMQPIVAKYYNSQGKSDFTNGFTPDILDEDAWNMPKKELGDIEEALLSKAIQQITGVAVSGAAEMKAVRSGTLPIWTIGSSLDHKVWKNQVILPDNSFPN